MLAVGIMASLAKCNPGPGEGLKFNLQQGKTYHYSTRYTVKQNEGSSIISDITDKFSMEVVNTSTNSKKLKVTYKDFIVSISEDSTLNTTGQKLPRGFSTVAESLVNAIFSSLKGKSFFITVNDYGKLVEVSGLNELLKPILDTMQFPMGGNDAAKQMILSGLGTRMIVGTFIQGFDIFPNRVVNIGDSWENEIAFNAMVPIAAKTVFTLKAQKGNELTIDGKSLLQDNNRKGEVISTYIVDARTGLVKDATIRTQFGIPVVLSSTGRITGTEE